MSFVSNTLSRNQAAFAAWAAVYDMQANPMLSLEERYLARMLPPTKGLDVLDLGCGTGRWLARFAGHADSLCGIDASQEMLEIAQQKCGHTALLFHASLHKLPSTSQSADLILTSFVLSYVDDLAACALEIARVARPGCDVFISDVHPETSAALAWKRGHSSSDVAARTESSQCSLEELQAVFVAAGLEVVAFLEPSFGAPERTIFEEHNKLGAFEQAENLPAIYLLHLRKRTAQFRVVDPTSLALRNAKIALGPDELTRASVFADNGTITALLSRSEASASSELDLHGYTIMPGLINAHDHLEFALYPRMGSGPYSDATEWALDIQRSHRETIDFFGQISKDTRLWWGGIRNLLCGVTTVAHHNPTEPVLLSNEFPIRVLSRYGWAHSLQFCSDVLAARGNTPADAPFILHAGEGVSTEAANEIAALNELGLLNEQTVLVHGLALDEHGVELLNERRTALVLCPTSNRFLFGATHNPSLLYKMQRAAIGSDSPLTADGDLLDELRFAQEAYRLSAPQVYQMVTESPADILRLKNAEGRVVIGGNADFIAVKDRSTLPAETLCTLSWKDVELVMIAGRVQVASNEIYSRLAAEMRAGLQALFIDGQVRWLRAPVAELIENVEVVLGKGKVRLNGRSVETIYRSPSILSMAIDISASESGLGGALHVS